MSRSRFPQHVAAVAPVLARANLHPHDHPYGDCAHHADVAPSASDAELGDALASFLGDTFIDHSVPPNKQWAIIVHALRAHGLKIADE